MSTAAERVEQAEEHQLWIGGEWVASESGRLFDDLNPEDDSVYARCAEATPADVERAVAAAKAAFPDYAKTLAAAREAWLCKAAELIERDSEELLELLVREGGSPIGKAHFEVGFAARYLRAAAGAARQMRGETIPSDMPGRFSMSVREPLGVTAAITPFNVPLVKNVKLSAMPLAMGNTVVLLASEMAPVVALRLARLYAEAGLPAGAFNVVTGMGADIGDSLTGHPDVKAVLFTGSSRVGAHISEICGRQRKRVVLELGGKNPLVVLRDADLDAAVEAAAFSMFFYQGQACMAASRIIVERPVYEAFLERFKARAESLGMGDLHEADTWVGPIISERQRARVRGHIEDAIAKGARLVTGGEWVGNRCKPTIFTDVGESATLCRQETFGPVTAVYPVDSAEEALEKANDTAYGLSAAVFTQDLNKALSLAQGIRAGMVHVNAPTLHDEPHVPFGGVGDSGFGREGTGVDIDTLTEWKWITVQLPGGGHG